MFVRTYMDVGEGYRWLIRAKRFANADSALLVTPEPLFFFVITHEPRVEWYKSLWVWNTSPPWNRCTSKVLCEHRLRPPGIIGTSTTKEHNEHAEENDQSEQENDRPEQANDKPEQENDRPEPHASAKRFAHVESAFLVTPQPWTWNSEPETPKPWTWKKKHIPWTPTSKQKNRKQNTIQSLYQI